MPNFVQLYRSTDTNSPVVSGQAGTMNALLQAILVDGYTTASVTSITESGTTYTATLAAGNITLLTGNYIKFAGATGGFTALNTTFGPITVNSSTEFTFTGPGSLGTPATGTITYRKAPLDWTNAFATASNVATFRGQSVTGRTTQNYLRVDDNGSAATPTFRECHVRSYVTMSDKDTGTEPYPTVVQQAAPGRVWRKSTSLDATARPWILVGDGATFYLVINSDNSTTAGRALLGFGGHLTDTAGDAGNSFLGGAATSNSGTPAVGSGGMGAVLSLGSATTWNNIFYRFAYTNTGTSKSGGLIQPWGNCIATPAVMSQLSGNPFANPHPVDGKVYVGPILCGEDGLAIRGRMPGLYGHMHSASPVAEGDQITTVAGLTGVTLFAVSVVSATTAGFALFDQFGPW